MRRAPGARIQIDGGASRLPCVGGEAETAPPEAATQRSRGQDAPPTADALGGVVATTATVSPTASPHLDAFIPVSTTGHGACCRTQFNKIAGPRTVSSVASSATTHRQRRKWADALQVSRGTERIGVRSALRASPSLQPYLYHCPRTTRFVRGNHWHVCAPLPAHGECLAVSIGIGNEWKFEDALVRAGCEVHAFDPTVELKAKHEKHAAAVPKLLHFHFEGLGKGGRDSGKRVGTWTPYGNVSGASTKGLDELLMRARGGNESRRITYPKIVRTPSRSDPKQLASRAPH